MKSEKIYDVVIIGGGAGGMYTSIIAKNESNSVCIIEKNFKLARKLYITGKGRCNVTNNCSNDEFLNNVETNNKFLYSACSRFNTKNLMEFFEKRGCMLKTERGGRVFPVSDRSLDIIKTLEEEIKKKGVIVKLNSEVIDLKKENEIFSIKVKSTVNDEIYSIYAKNVVLATGGKSYPVTGSDGNALSLVLNLGHSMKKMVPSLVPISTIDTDIYSIQGLSLRNVGLSVKDLHDKVIFSEIGEMMFTHFGITGPLVLTASSKIGNEIRKNENTSVRDYHIFLDLKPGLDDAKLDKRILRDFDKYKNKEISNALVDLLNKRMIECVLKRSGIYENTKVHEITKEQRRDLINTIKRFKIELKEFRSWDEAIITKGGINVKEINPKNMESKIVSGLYFVGEVLDLDALTGGYNLQIVWTTAFAAGEDISKRK